MIAGLAPEPSQFAGRVHLRLDPLQHAGLHLVVLSAKGDVPAEVLEAHADDVIGAEHGRRILGRQPGVREG